MNRFGKYLLLSVASSLGLGWAELNTAGAQSLAQVPDPLTAISLIQSEAGDDPSIADSAPESSTPAIAPEAVDSPSPAVEQALVPLAQILDPPLDPPPPDEADTPGSRPRLKTQPDSGENPLYRPRADILLDQTPRYSPGISLLTPTAFGKRWRQYSVGIGFQERTRFTNQADGAVGIGLGAGDPQKFVGLDVGITFTDLSDPLDRGIVSFKLHRQIQNNLAIAVGVNDAISWGNGDIDGPSPYGVVSKIFVLKENPEAFLSRIAVSAGAGTGRYRSEFNIFNDNDNPNVFGSVAFRVLDPVNLITEWSGQDLSMGLSVRPIPKIPLVITPAVTDITGNAGDGWRFILGVGYSSQF
ncbi:hypothetical protein [Lyngbya confervoides]|uniref:Transporter n=1 Tax=Lyngbya confervoides BDU141951 TaxID=1574623 RepID=A0ABD4T3R3_9CYAN|nr:hypothetical protein [Lyngbya confervoides]MCM1983296.1 hypothetical protein [Lyngbya confervoides BDU141951]